MAKPIDVGEADNGDNTPKQAQHAHLAKYHFKKGQPTLNPKGRPKGSRNKISEAFIQALHTDFAEHGAQAIVDTRESKPAEYIRTVASLVPKEVLHRSATDDMSDDDLEDIISSLADSIERVRAARGEAIEANWVEVPPEDS